jgi:hypothetical protein
MGFSSDSTGNFHTEIFLTLLAKHRDVDQRAWRCIGYEGSQMSWVSYNDVIIGRDNVSTLEFCF